MVLLRSPSRTAVARCPSGFPSMILIIKPLNVCSLTSVHSDFGNRCPCGGCIPLCWEWCHCHKGKERKSADNEEYYCNQYCIAFCLLCHDNALLKFGRMSVHSYFSSSNSCGCPSDLLASGCKAGGGSVCICLGHQGLWLLHNNAPKTCVRTSVHSYFSSSNSCGDSSSLALKR